MQSNPAEQTAPAILANVVVQKLFRSDADVRLGLNRCFHLSNVAIQKPFRGDVIPSLSTEQESGSNADSSLSLR